MQDEATADRPDGGDAGDDDPAPTSASPEDAPPADRPAAGQSTGGAAGGRDPRDPEGWTGFWHGGVRLPAGRPSRTQIAFLVALTLLLLGPLVALIAVLATDTQELSTLAAEDGTPAGGARVVVAVDGVSPTTSELRVRIVVQPDGPLLRNNRPVEDLTLVVNDIRGQSTVGFPAGQPITPVEFNLALEQGSIVRYPFDDYSAELVLLLTQSTTATGEPQALPVTLEITASTVVDYVTTATIEPSPGDPGAFRKADFQVNRNGPTVFYAVWIMLLMWGLSASGVLIVWALVIWRLDVPWWTFGFFVGVLFALPPLRSSLPGNPPPGVLVDFVSFYWAVTIIGVCLLVTVGIFLRRERRARIEGGP